jgi:hypothetical protein
MVTPGFEPTIGDRKPISSATVPTANRPETKHDKINATAALLFILEILSFKIVRRFE